MTSRVETPTEIRPFNDWRKVEAKLNALPQFTTEIDGLDIHFIHVKSPHENALPLIITHGWPGSVIEMLEVVGPLTDPTAHGGRAEDAFDLVIPSMPGYGFSGKPTEVGWGARSHRASVGGADEAPRLHPLRRSGRRLGRPVADAMARQAPNGLLGIHLNLLSAFPTEVPAALFGGEIARRAVQAGRRAAAHSRREGTRRHCYAVRLL